MSRLILVLLLAASIGCAVRSDLMTPTHEPAAALSPPAAEALVVFLRPSRIGGMVQAVVYDGDELIGIVSAGTAVAYRTVPGSHRFRVVSEAADFLDADLLGGRTYFARVEPRMGLWRARFSLLPIDPRREADDLARWERAEVVEAGPRAWAWDRDNR